MTHVVAEPCFGCKYTDCVVVCPVECFYEGEKMLYIHPDECIDCEACVPECPVEAIFHEDNLPEEWKEFTALNGGPVFKFNEAISFQVYCETQEEIDYYWNKLSEGGDKTAQQCGWLKDKYGVSWQVIPRMIGEWVSSPDSQKSDRVMKEVLQMKKIDLAKLKRAYEGQRTA